MGAAGGAVTGTSHFQLAVPVAACVARSSFAIWFYLLKSGRRAESASAVAWQLLAPEARETSCYHDGVCLFGFGFFPSLLAIILAPLRAILR